MFESTRAFALFDYFRVPYEQVENEPAAHGVASLSVRGRSAATLSWPIGAALIAERRRPGSYLLESTPVFGRVAPDEKVRSWLQQIGGNWVPDEHVRNEQGTLV